MTGGKQIQSALHHFLNRSCLGFSSKKVSGTHIFILRFEPRRENVKRGSVIRADYAIVVYCSWRLENEQAVICGSQSDRSASVKAGLKGVKDKRVMSLSFAQPGFDVDIYFENGLKLRLFCDQVNEDDEIPNYLLYLKEEVLLVGPRSRLSAEPRIMSED